MKHFFVDIYYRRMKAYGVDTKIIPDVFTKGYVLAKKYARECDTVEVEMPRIYTLDDLVPAHEIEDVAIHYDAGKYAVERIDGKIVMSLAHSAGSIDAREMACTTHELTHVKQRRSGRTMTVYEKEKEAMLKEKAIVDLLVTDSSILNELLMERITMYLQGYYEYKKYMGQKSVYAGIAKDFAFVDEDVFVEDIFVSQPCRMGVFSVLVYENLLKEEK